MSKDSDFRQLAFLHGPPPKVVWLRIGNVTTVEIAGSRFSAGGGGFFRLWPYALFRAAVRRVNLTDRQAAVFYMHPWEIDVAQPRVAGAPARSRLRHYLNLHRVWPRLRRLLADFRWDRVDRVFGVPAP